jgi:ubiquinone/menaquinone biosynthesis methyltransferase
MRETPAVSPTSPSNAAEFDALSDNVFARIADRYDRLCDVFSMGIHRLWKRRIAAKIADHEGHVVLDVASGTGDIPLRIGRRLSRGQAQNTKTIFVTDICPEMLVIARGKLASATFNYSIQEADAHDLQAVASNSIDIFSISFGMKICRRDRVIAEALRVLKPGGAFFCLEAARITVAPLHAAYLKYMDWCLPTIAHLATGGDASAYNYLLKGVHEFPDQKTFADELSAAGFKSVRFANLTLGIVAIHEAMKPA